LIARFNPRARPRPCPTRPHHGDTHQSDEVSILGHDQGRARRTPAPRQRPQARFQSSGTTKAVPDSRGRGHRATRLHSTPLREPYCFLPSPSSILLIDLSKNACGTHRSFLREPHGISAST
jgi:hypothetical protein